MSGGLWFPGPSPYSITTQPQEGHWIGRLIRLKMQKAPGGPPEALFSLVGTRRFELLTPTASRWCSPPELRA